MTGDSRTSALPITGPELHAQLWREQGFLVMCISGEGCEIGSIHTPDYSGDREAGIPLRCIGTATHAEFVRQVERMNQISGEVFYSDHVAGNRYYKMEPMD